MQKIQAYNVTIRTYFGISSPLSFGLDFLLHRPHRMVTDLPASQTWAPLVPTSPRWNLCQAQSQSIKRRSYLSLHYYSVCTFLTMHKCVFDFFMKSWFNLIISPSCNINEKYKFSATSSWIIVLYFNTNANILIKAKNQYYIWNLIHCIIKIYIELS